jgi:hypothetical protein
MRRDLFRFCGDHIPRAAIFLSGAGTHTGIVYRDEHDRLTRLEFFLNGGIDSEPWDGRHFHVLPNTDDDALDTLSSLCRVLSRRYSASQPEHLFGFGRDPRAYVDPRTGQLHLGGAAGASCASFVIIVFSSARIQLVVDPPDWRERPSDDVRHDELFLMLTENPRYSPADLTQIHNDLPCPRVAPVEVTGAGMYPNLPDEPASQEFAENAARWIMGLFEHNRAHGITSSP